MTLDTLDSLKNEVAQAVEPKPEPPPARKLGELERHGDEDPTELLKHRYLCRGAGLLLVGPTGVGKSAFSMQCMIMWALGREAFGIAPKGAIKSLLVQAENDDGDLAEMRDGIMQGLKLSSDEMKRAGENIVVVREDSRTGMLLFSATIRPLLEADRPDLLWIDPALSFLGGEANSQKDVGGFLRNLLNPLLREFNCGSVIVHHTNKPSKGGEKPDWQAGDFAYLGSGSSEWANWARAVLAIRSVGSHEVFQLCAGKRGGRLRWKEADGATPAYAKAIGHAREPGAIYWRGIEMTELPDAGKSTTAKKGKADIMPHVPVEKPIVKDVLRCKANQAGIGFNKVYSMISELIADGKLFEWRIPRPGTRPEILIARFPQPPQGDLKV